MNNLTDKKRWFPFGLGTELASMRIFCLPFAGGGASFFLPWRKTLTDVALVPVQYPGHETRLKELCHTDLANLVDELAFAMLPHLDRPYLLLGYSLGAKVGFALSHRLAALGAPDPELFITIAHGSPDTKSTHPDAADLPDVEFRDLVRQFGGMPEQVFQDPELANLLLPILRADIGLVAHPVPLLPLKCSILAYAGEQDNAASPSSMEKWQRFSSGEFNLRTFDGGHFFARSNSGFLPTLAADIAAINTVQKCI
ncbi:MAG: alpha/beta fold hydrolase [Gallionellaceae bacterium]